MGGRPSVSIQTPNFIESDWQVVKIDNDSLQYGMYRTLKHKLTGQMVDEYDMVWMNQQQYNYYLKSFNWRHKQSNVVNTKYIVEKGNRQLCSQSYAAKIYIQHMLTRLCQINDIPYPDNLYVLIQALEGYSKIYQHSQYFLIQQSQICVDNQGNVKVWVNSDLSINYPNNQGYNQYHHFGEEDMVDKLIDIIAQNTDRQTQPETSFIEYYQNKKTGKGLKFQQAKVMIIAYARLNNTVIPNKFQAVLSITRDQDIPDHQISHHTSQSSLKIQQPHYQPHNQPIHIPHQTNFIQNSSINSIPTNQPLKIYIPPPQIVHQNIYRPPPTYLPQHPVYQVHQQPIPQLIHPTPLHTLPHYTRIEYPKINHNYNGVIHIPPQIQPTQNTIISQNMSSTQSLPRNTIPHIKHKISGLQSDQIRISYNHNDLSGSNKFIQQQNAQQQEQFHIQEGIFSNRVSPSNISDHMRNVSQRQPSMTQNQTNIAKSLPIKGGIIQNGQTLSLASQVDRSTFSHINHTTHLHHNDGFGLTRNSGVQLKQSSLSYKAKNIVQIQTQKQKIQKKSLRYYISLDQQAQIDPQIASDIQKYLT